MLPSLDHPLFPKAAHETIIAMFFHIIARSHDCSFLDSAFDVLESKESQQKSAKNVGDIKAEHTKFPENSKAVDDLKPTTAPAADASCKLTAKQSEELSQASPKILEAKKLSVSEEKKPAEVKPRPPPPPVIAPPAPAADALNSSSGEVEVRMKNVKNLFVFLSSCG